MGVTFTSPTIASIIAGVLSVTGPTVSFADGNGVSFGAVGNTVTASVAFSPDLGIKSLSAGTTRATGGEVIFSNSNGVTFGMDNGTVTASYTVPTVPAQTVQTQNVVVPAASDATFTSGTVVFTGSNAVTVKTGAQSIIIDVPVQTAQTQSVVQGISAGTQVGRTGDIVFSNSNGVTFGMSGSTRITASVSSVVFSNSNNVSFGLNAGTLTATATVTYPAQTNQTAGLYAAGNTVGESSSSTFDARTLSFSGAGIASVGYSAGRVLISVPADAAQTVQTQNVVVPSAGTQTATSGTVVFSNSNGISFGMSGSSRITASYTVPATAGLISNINLSAGTTSNNLAAVTFSNSNGVSFGLNASTVTGSVAAGATATGNLGAVAGGTQTATSGTIVFSDSNGISFGLSGSTRMTASYTVPSTAGLVSAINVSGGTTSNNLSAITFSNSNGVSFGLNASTMTGSVAAGATATGNFGALAAGTQTGTSGTMVFSDSNGISFGMSGSTRITASYTVPSTAGLISAVNLSAGTTSSNAASFVFSNSNNVSFGINGATVTATATVAQSAQTQNVVVPSAGTQTATSGTVVWSNSNGISFGMSGSSRITASYTVPSTAGLISAVNVSAGTTSNNLSAITFSNANGVTFGLDGSTITASVSPGGGLTNVNLSAGTTSNNLSAFVFSNSNNVSFGLAGSTVTATISVPAQTVQTVGLYALGNTTQNSSTTLDARTLSFNALGAATMGYSNGSIQVSVPVQTAQTQSNIQAIYDGANSISTGTIRFTNANGVSFSVNGQTISGSVAAQTAQTVGLYALGNTTQNSSTTLDARTLSFNGLGGVTVGYSNGSIQISGPQTVAQTNQTVGMYALGNTTQNSSTTLDARTLSFNGLGIVTVGYSNGSIQVSATQSAQTQSLIAALYDGAASISTGTARFSNSNGVSFGINGQTITASHNGITSQTNQTLGLYAVSNTTGQSSSSTFDARTLSFQGAGIASVGYSGGSVVISVPAGAPSPVNFSAGTTSGNLGSVVFSNSNNVSFGINGSTITATITVPAQTNQTIGLYALGNTTQNSSSTMDARTLSFNGLGGATLGYSNGSIQVSVPPGRTLYTYEPYPLAVSQTAVLSANNGTSGAASFFPILIEENVAAEFLNVAVSMNFLTVGTSSGRQSQTISYGLYSRGTGTNSTTLSAFTSGGFTLNVTGNNSSYTINQATSTNSAGYTNANTNSAGSNISSGYTGGKLVNLPIHSTLTPGNYWLGLFVRNSTSSVNVGISQSFIGGPVAGTIMTMAPIGSFSSAFSTGTNVLRGVGGPWHLGLASFTSAAQTNLPGTVAFSAMTHNLTVIPYMKFWQTE